MIKNSKAILADKIAGVLSTTPACFDPEDIAVDDTEAKLTKNLDQDESDVEEEILSKFRTQNVDFLADVDERYAGKKGSRKVLRDSEEESSDEEEHNEGMEDDESAIEDDEDFEEEEEKENDSDENDEEEESVGEDYMEESEDDTAFKHINDSDTSQQVSKGICVRNQMITWENLLEMRIQLQKCLLTANKLPQSEVYNDIKSSDSDFPNKIADTKNNMCNLLDKMLLLQKLVLNKYPETRKLNKESEKPTEENDEDDEEIPSDTEEEKSEDDAEEEPEAAPSKKRKLQDYEKEISTRHKIYTNYRNSVIKKWNDKTRLAVAKNNVNSHTVLDQIEHNLSDKPKLIKRTQLKRSNYHILGQNDNEEVPEEYNSEIFDDDDFYHQLLRELIEVKSADLTDPVQLSRQWIQLQNMRNKMKRKIDTKATKGRKIRYAVHKKLVNFMAPIDENLWTDEAKTELYNSLFGKNK